MTLSEIKKPSIQIQIEHIGGGLCEHNLICWLCNKEPAVYDMNPNWVFRPCWTCQKSCGLLPKEKAWWEFWK